MLAVVTGAAGFIGSAIVDALLARGDQVRGIDAMTPYYDPARKRANVARALQSERFDLVEADLRHADLAALVDGADVVFHVAGQPGVRLSWADGFATYVDHNIVATQSLLESLRDSTVRRLVYSSSSSIYGDHARYPTHEDDATSPHSPYGVTKLAGEHLCNAYGENFGVPSIALRYFTVFGPRQRPDMAMHRLIEAAFGGPAFKLFGDGKQVRDFTFIDDIVCANLAAADVDVPPGTTVNVAGGEATTLNEAVALVGDLAGREVPVERGPAQPGDVRRTGASTERAERLLGWKPAVSVRKGIAAQLAWHVATRSG